MFTCAEFLSEFGDYPDNNASPELRAKLEHHLRECKTCEVILDTARKTIRIVTDSDSFTLPDEAVEPIVKQIMERLRDKRPNT